MTIEGVFLYMLACRGLLVLLFGEQGARICVMNPTGKRTDADRPDGITFKRL